VKVPADTFKRYKVFSRDEINMAEPIGRDAVH